MGNQPTASAVDIAPQYHYYGMCKVDGVFRLVHVSGYTWSFSQNCQRASQQLHLINRHEFCWDWYEYWDFVPKVRKSNYFLAEGISEFSMYDIPNEMANWMDTIRDDVPLRQMALPGSHGAGSAQCERPPGMYRTQAYSIITQLMLGIRVFDMKLTRGRKVVGGDIWTCHVVPTSGNSVVGENLGRVLNGVEMFLKTHGSETVLFVISHDHGIDWREINNKLLTEMDELIIADQSRVTQLTIGEARGKLVLIKDEENQIACHRGPNGIRGTTNWAKMLDHLNAINTQQPPTYHKLVAALTYGGGLFPKELALYRGLPGLRAWLKSRESDNIGIVEADWWGSCQQVIDDVKLVTAKNTKKGLNK